MKNSIGSLAALAAFVAPALVEATPLPPPRQVQAAGFENVTLSFANASPIDFDIDGDSTADFFVFGNSGVNIRASMLNGTQITASPVAFGTSFDRSQALQTFDETINPGFDGYYGFDFISGIDGQHHAAWVRFDFTGLDPLAVNGAWESQPFYTSLTVGVIPEPSAAGILAGTGALLGAFVFRRRRTA